MKYYETLYELLAKQYEVARIDEAKDATIIQVLDRAVLPERKSKPKRSLIMLLSTLAAGFIAILWAFVRESTKKAEADPQQAERLARLKAYLRFRRG